MCRSCKGGPTKITRQSDTKEIFTLTASLWQPTLPNSNLPLGEKDQYWPALEEFEDALAWQRFDTQENIDYSSSHSS